jgi:hypothetical protein
MYFFSLSLFQSVYRMGGGSMDAIPHPGVEWKTFIAKLKDLGNREAKVFCPISQKMKPWVDAMLLPKFYPTESQNASGSCVVS